MAWSTAASDQGEPPVATRTRRQRTDARGGCLITRTGHWALAATAFEMLPSMSRLKPDKPRDPNTIRSHCSSTAVCKIVSATLPHFNSATCGTPACMARTAVWASISCPCCSTLSINNSDEAITSGMAYTPETFSTVRIHRSAPIWAARAIAYADTASDHGLPPVAMRMRLYIESRLRACDEQTRLAGLGCETRRNYRTPPHDPSSNQTVTQSF